MASTKRFTGLGGARRSLPGTGGSASAPALVVPLWLVWLAALVFVFGTLGSFGISDNNEGLYAEVPREMLTSADWRMWVIPHLNGLPYMEKPPLLYWLTALSFSLFGQTEWAARLVPALSTLGCVGMLLRFGSMLDRQRAGRMAALMFVSGTGVMVMSHVLMFDMLLTALLAAALMLAWFYRRGGRPATIRWAYVFLALAVLAKGVVAVALFGLAMFVYQLFDSRSLHDFLNGCALWLEPRALLLFAAVAAPWHIAAAFLEPAFAWFYFINEHVLRFLGRRIPHDYYGGAWWYYLPRMVIYLFPWPFLLAGMPASRPEPDAGTVSLRRFLLASWLAPLLFFSLSSAKANYYPVMGVPFAAFHLALALEQRNFFGSRARALPGVALAALASVLCLIVAHRTDDPARAVTLLGLSQKQFLFGLFAGIGLLAALAALWAKRVERIGVQAYLVLPLWIAAALVAALQAMEPNISSRTMARFLQSELPGREVYLYRNFEELSSLPFYLKRTLPVVDTRSSDLYWGNRLQPNRILISVDMFRHEVAAHPAAVVVMQGQLDGFRAAGLAALFGGEKRIGDSTVFFN